MTAHATPTEVEVDVVARFGEALADGTRRRILLLLLAGPAYPSDIAEVIGCGRPRISNHLACLRGCGLVTVVSEGRRCRYELAGDGVADVLRAMTALVLPAPGSDQCAVAS